MMGIRRRDRAGAAFVSMLLLLTGCTALEARLETAGTPVTARGSVLPVRWQINPTCLQAEASNQWHSREHLASQCPAAPRQHDQVSIALSGGGSKASIFSAETLFYLQALGLLQETSVLSSVSGGSFAAAMYALSCDDGDRDCLARAPYGRPRLVWRHDPVMAALAPGNREVVDDQILRALLPFTPSSVSAGHFASIIDRVYFSARAPGAEDTLFTGNGMPFTFADVNPKRPHLFLNATIVSDNRGGLGSSPINPDVCRPLDRRGYLRRRTPDEYFHFAFTDEYFTFIGAQHASYPVAAGVAASAAFPVLIDLAELTDFCEAPHDVWGPAGDGRRNVIKLMDGGVNDNQAIIEVYLLLAEMVYGQHRSAVNSDAIERLRPNDRAFVFVVNSAVTESTGVSASGGGSEPRAVGIIDLLSGAVSKALDAIDVYSAEGYNLRKQSYVAQLLLNRRTPSRYAAILPAEISLTALDQYESGGTEAALRSKAFADGVSPPDEATDFAQRLAEARVASQRRAYKRIVEHAAVRTALHLSDHHPQCYFDLRAELDASLISLPPEDQACLREAARWVTALRAQELCDDLPRRPDALQCDQGVPVLPFASVNVLGEHEDEQRMLCAARLDRQIAQQSAAREQRGLPAPPPEVTCRALIPTR